MMTVHDALEAWQAGEITAARAMELTDVSEISALYALAKACDVEIRIERSDSEIREAGLAMIRERAARADVGVVIAILEKVPDVPAEPGDEIQAKL